MLKKIVLMSVAFSAGGFFYLSSADYSVCLAKKTEEKNVLIALCVDESGPISISGDSELHEMKALEAKYETRLKLLRDVFRDFLMGAEVEDRLSLYVFDEKTGYALVQRIYQLSNSAEYDLTRLDVTFASELFDEFRYSFPAGVICRTIPPVHGDVEMVEEVDIEMAEVIKPQYEILASKRLKKGFSRETQLVIEESLHLLSQGIFENRRDLGNGVYELKFATQLRIYYIVFENITISELREKYKYVCILGAGDNKVEQDTIISTVKDLRDRAYEGVLADLAVKKKAQDMEDEAMDEYEMKRTKR